METMGAFFIWVLFGLFVGLIARALYPGRQPMWLGTTIALGIAGSLIGGLIARAVMGTPERGAFDGAGWIMSIVGALIVLGVAAAFNQPRRLR